MRTASYGLSITMHVALGAAIVWRTLDARPHAPSPPLMFVVPPYHATWSPVAPTAPTTIGSFPLPVIDPPSIPLLGVAAPRLVAFDVRPLPGGIPAGTAGDQAVDVLHVEEPPAILAGPAPEYPELLRQAGLTGRVLLEAVVDTSGRVEPGSLTVIASSHPGFVASAQRSLAATLFRPARVYGRAVRVRVRVPVDFRLRGGRLSGQ
jgi:periplasmic protein TonB